MSVLLKIFISYCKMSIKIYKREMYYDYVLYFNKCNSFCGMTFESSLEYQAVNERFQILLY